MKTTILVLALFSSLVQAEVEPVKTVPAANKGLQSSISVSSLVTTSTDAAWVDQKIEEIKPQRNGLSNNALAALRSPFIVIIPKPKDDGKPKVDKVTTDAKSLLPTKKDMSKEPLTLQIILNSSALINGKWLKEDDKFRGYKLSKIQNNHVVMERKNKKIKLFIAQKSNNINISTK